MTDSPPALPYSSRVHVQAELLACSSLASRLTLHPALWWDITAVQGKCTELDGLKSTQASSSAHGDAALQAVNVNLPLWAHCSRSTSRVTSRYQWTKMAQKQYNEVRAIARSFSEEKAARAHMKGHIFVSKLRFSAFTPTNPPFYSAAHNPLSPHSKLQTQLTISLFSSPPNIATILVGVSATKRSLMSRHRACSICGIGVMWIKRIGLCINCKLWGLVTHFRLHTLKGGEVEQGRTGSLDGNRNSWGTRSSLNVTNQKNMKVQRLGIRHLWESGLWDHPNCPYFVSVASSLGTSWLPQKSQITFSLDFTQDLKETLNNF